MGVQHSAAESALAHSQYNAYKTTPADADMMHGNPLHTFAKQIFVPSLGTERPFPDKDSTPELHIQDVGKLEQCRTSIVLRGHQCFSISCDKIIPNTLLVFLQISWM